jgi:hypothetical protein
MKHEANDTLHQMGICDDFTTNTSNKNTGMDVMQKYNIMTADQKYDAILANTWKQV